MESTRTGWLPDFNTNLFFRGELTYENGMITAIREFPGLKIPWPDPSPDLPLILPGLVDAHVHIESSMLIPSRFARKAIQFGTVATVSDPHEIANVLGLDGIRFMIKDAERTPMKIFFTAPSCVPATSLESSGAILDAASLEQLMHNREVVALGEMMNYPGVVGNNPAVMEKIRMAQYYNLPVDGHAPGLMGSQLDAYLSAGISTDHECSSMEEAEEKIEKGMKILIREGSAARNFNILAPLINRFPDRVMLCTDDFHPDDLLNHHLDELVRRGLAMGLNFFNIFRAAVINPVEHYGLNVGLLKKDDPADFILVNNLDEFRIIETVINGVTVFDGNSVSVTLTEVQPVNCFKTPVITPASIKVSGPGGNFRIIQAVDGELITGSAVKFIKETNGEIKPDPDIDVLKIVVLNRYQNAPPAIGWIGGFGLRSGAIASTIAHDSHNIIAVGVTDEDVAAAINAVINHKGGIAFCDHKAVEVLPLPVAGLMSTDEAEVTGTSYSRLSQMVKENGSNLKAPFMTLSFMALLVIPHLKMSDRGLFDVDIFNFVPVKID